MSDTLVIIPTFNEKENVEAIIRATFNQKKAFHILIVDDNSPDGTSDIVTQLITEFPQYTSNEIKRALQYWSYTDKYLDAMKSHQYRFTLECLKSDPITSEQKQYASDMIARKRAKAKTKTKNHNACTHTSPSTVRHSKNSGCFSHIPCHSS